MTILAFLDSPIQRFELTKEKTLIGRDAACDIVLDSQSVSKQHALISINGDRASLADLDSRNGTFINETRISSKSLPLPLKCNLRFGYDNVYYVFYLNSSTAVIPPYEPPEKLQHVIAQPVRFLSAISSTCDASSHHEIPPKQVPRLSTPRSFSKGNHIESIHKTEKTKEMEKKQGLVPKRSLDRPPISDCSKFENEDRVLKVNSLLQEWSELKQNQTKEASLKENLTKEASLKENQLKSTPIGDSNSVFQHFSSLNPHNESIQIKSLCDASVTASPVSLSKDIQVESKVAIETTDVSNQTDFPPIFDHISFFKRITELLGISLESGAEEDGILSEIENILLVNTRLQQGLHQASRELVEATQKIEQLHSTIDVLSQEDELKNVIINLRKELEQTKLNNFLLSQKNEALLDVLGQTQHSDTDVQNITSSLLDDVIKYKEIVENCKTMIKSHATDSKKIEQLKRKVTHLEGVIENQLRFHENVCRNKDEALDKLRRSIGDRIANHVSFDDKSTAAKLVDNVKRIEDDNRRLSTALFELQQKYQALSLEKTPIETQIDEQQSSKYLQIVEENANSKLYVSKLERQVSEMELQLQQCQVDEKKRTLINSFG
ncbi:hypothetical protein RCL1_005066 [Eukaryota sp. TZLM3-RCL]